MAEAEIGHRHDVIGQVQDAAQIGVVKDADPADADAFGASRQPQVLHRAHRAVEIHRFVVGAPQHHGAGAISVAGHAQVERRFENALEAQLPVLISPFFLEQ